MASYTESELAAISEQLDLAAAEADAALADQEARATSIESRAGVLTAASAVVGAVQVTTQSTGWVPLLLLFSFIAAAIGLFAVKPRWTKILNPSRFVPGLLAYVNAPKSALYSIVVDKQWLFEKREPGLKFRAVLVLIGYGFLVISIFAALVVALIAVPPSK